MFVSDGLKIHLWRCNDCGEGFTKLGDGIKTCPNCKSRNTEMERYGVDVV